MKQIAMILAALSTAAFAQQVPDAPKGGMGTPDGGRSGPSMMGSDLNPGSPAPDTKRPPRPTQTAKSKTHKTRSKPMKRD